MISRMCKIRCIRVVSEPIKVGIEARVLVLRGFYVGQGSFALMQRHDKPKSRRAALIHLVQLG